MWGDGKQTRSFTFIDDCVEGILRITKSDFKEPLNLGSTEMVSMNQMMELVMGFAEGASVPLASSLPNPYGFICVLVTFPAHATGARVVLLAVRADGLGCRRLVPRLPSLTSCVHP